VRTSFSTLVRESYDFSCIVTDAAGKSLVQATESIPSFIGTLPATVKHFLRFFPPESLAPSDVLITNDLLPPKQFQFHRIEAAPYQFKHAGASSVRHFGQDRAVVQDRGGTVRTDHEGAFVFFEHRRAGDASAGR
jgi:hypothetical protein